jgi:linearmycin/streptolysin S transport system permease protein
VKVLAIVRTNMRRFLRDRTALFFTAALPVILIFLIGTATAGFDTDAYPVGVVSHGKGKLTDELRRALDGSRLMDLQAYDDRESLAKEVRRGVVPAGLVIPADYDARLLSGKDVNVELILDQTRGSPAAVRSAIAEVVADQGAELQAAGFASRRTHKPVTTTLREARRTAELFESVAIGVDAKTVGTEESDEYLPPGIGYQAPSNLILFVFITSVAGSAALIRSRQLRVTQRMYATPTTARTIVAGEGLARLSIAGYQAALLFVVGVLVFGVDYGNPLGAAALIVLWVLVGTSIGMLFGTVFRTPEQAGSVGPMAGIAMGMLGGCMWPLEIVPEPMQRIGHLFPHAWAMDAWIELIGRGGTIADITTQLAVLAGFVAVLLPLATWRLRRAIVA